MNASHTSCINYLNLNEVRFFEHGLVHVHRLSPVFAASISITMLVIRTVEFISYPEKMILILSQT